MTWRMSACLCAIWAANAALFLAIDFPVPAAIFCAAAVVAGVRLFTEGDQ